MWSSYELEKLAEQREAEVRRYAEDGRLLRQARESRPARPGRLASVMKRSARLVVATFMRTNQRSADRPVGQAEGRPN